MENNLIKNLDCVIDCCSDEISATLLESYIFTYIERHINRENCSGDIIVLLGNLSYIYGKKDITVHRVKNYINKITSIIPHIDKFLCEHISNFMEMVLLHKPELIRHYLLRLEHNINNESDDNNAILYSAVVIASLRNEIRLGEILLNCKYAWRSYSKMSSYYLYYNNKTESLNYIIKAIKSCPEELKEIYRKKEEYIVDQIIIDSP